MSVDHRVADRFDSVYTLPFPSWRQELVSNRIHYGRRWAERLPHVMVHTGLERGQDPFVEPNPRFGNSSVLHVLEDCWDPMQALARGVIQARQIAAHMERSGHRRPLLWLYNPTLVLAFTLVPAVMRVFHATENYFNMKDQQIDDQWLALKRAAIETADVVVACTSGVRRSLISETGRRDVVCINNGVDLKAFVEAPEQDRFKTLRSGWRHLIGYGGNVNIRLDFALLRRAIEQFSDCLFVFAGKVNLAGLQPSQVDDWKACIARPNFQSIGQMDLAEVASFLKACDLAIIPYRQDLPFVVEDTFPIKTMEAVSVGVPVVSTLMKSLDEVRDVVTVTEAADDFLAEMAALLANPWSPARKAEALARAEAYDYDRLFETMIEALLSRPIARRAAAGSLDRALAKIDPTQTEKMLALCRDGGPANASAGASV